MSDMHIRDTRFVVGGEKLLTARAVDELIRCEEIRALVQDMRASEGEVSRLLEDVAPSQLHIACQQAIAKLMPQTLLPEQCDGSDALSFARAIYNLPRRLSDSYNRRLAREVARTYANLCAGGLIKPRSVNDFRSLWEMSMQGEPRWSDDFPTSEFRTMTATVIRSPFSGEVAQICTEPANVETELAQLLTFLGDDRLDPEVRAACSFLSLEFTHPFTDGNGHTGRMLLLSMLQEHYCLPTMLCFARELALERGRASLLFGLVRSGEHSVADFCAATLSYLHEAQRGVEDLLSCHNWSKEPSGNIW